MAAKTTSAWWGRGICCRLRRRRRRRTQPTLSWSRRRAVRQRGSRWPPPRQRPPASVRRAEVGRLHPNPTDCLTLTQGCARWRPDPHPPPRPPYPHSHLVPSSRPTGEWRQEGQSRPPFGVRHELHHAHVQEVQREVASQGGHQAAKAPGAVLGGQLWWQVPRRQGLQGLCVDTATQPTPYRGLVPERSPRKQARAGRCVSMCLHVLNVFYHQ